MTDYIIANPSGNITALVLSDTLLSERIKVASDIMAKEKDVEQVGFITMANADTRKSDSGVDSPVSVRLDMAGGEFCGNATLSAASYVAFMEGIKAGESYETQISVSGVGRPLSVHVTENEPDSCVPARGDDSEVRCFTGTVEMSAPLSVTEYNGMPLVHFPGISHLIADKSAFTPENALDNIRIIASDLEVPALGIMLWDKTTDYIEPLVYVADGNTLFWEHCCASGSCALGAYLYSLDNNNTATVVSQPGGKVKIEIINRKIYMTGQILLYLPRKS